MTLRKWLHVGRHRWQPTQEYEDRYTEYALPLFGQWFQCACGARRWDITREAVKRGLWQ